MIFEEGKADNKDINKPIHNETSLNLIKIHPLNIPESRTIVPVQKKDLVM